VVMIARGETGELPPINMNIRGAVF
jgi:hypothetical protein